MGAEEELFAEDAPYQRKLEIKAEEEGGRGKERAGGVGQEARIGVAENQIAILEELDERAIGEGGDVVPKIPINAGEEAEVGAHENEMSAGAEDAAGLADHLFDGPFSREVFEEVAGEDHIHRVVRKEGQLADGVQMKLGSGEEAGGAIGIKIHADAPLAADIIEELAVPAAQIQDGIGGADPALQEVFDNHLPQEDFGRLLVRVKTVAVDPLHLFMGDDHGIVYRIRVAGVLVGSPRFVVRGVVGLGAQMIPFVMASLIQGMTSSSI